MRAWVPFLVRELKYNNKNLKTVLRGENLGNVPLIQGPPWTAPRGPFLLSPTPFGLLLMTPSPSCVSLIPWGIGVPPSCYHGQPEGSIQVLVPPGGTQGPVLDTGPPKPQVDLFEVSARSHNRCYVVVVQCLSHVQIFSTLWTAARQASLSSTVSQSLSKLASIE